MAAKPPRGPCRWRVAGTAFGLGVVLYTADSALFYAALGRTSAPFAIAAALRVPPRASSASTALSVASGSVLDGSPRSARCSSASPSWAVAPASPDPLGIVLALASASAYAAYVLFSDRMLRGIDPVAFAALLVAGAATAFLVFGAARGELGAIGGGVGSRRSSSGRSSAPSSR